VLHLVAPGCPVAGGHRRQPRFAGFATGWSYWFMSVVTGMAKKCSYGVRRYTTHCAVPLL
jgi:L-asparagine transporter-like permease